MMSARAMLTQWLLEESWQKSKRMGGLYKPWSWSEHYPLARLNFPRLHQQLVVLANDGSDQTDALMHLRGSVMPGQKGVSVIGGNTERHFAFADQLFLDESLQMELPCGAQQRFRVSKVLLTDVMNTRLALQAETPVIVLIACYPLRTLAWDCAPRLVIVAEQASADCSMGEAAKFYL